MRLAVVLLLVGCGRIGFDERSASGSGSTSLRASISSTSLLSIVGLDARLAFATLDPDQLHAIPADGGAPALPVESVFALPDVSGDLTLTVTARDARGRTIETSAMTPIEAFAEQPLTLVLGDQVVAHCFNGSRDVDERDVDCGGSCPACGVGSSCATFADCATGACISNFCEPASGPPAWLPIADAPNPRIGGGAALGRDDRIYVFGGGPGDTTQIANVDIYDADTDTWSAGPPLPIPRVRMATTADRAGTLYAIAGTGGAGITSNVESYVPGAAAWTIGPDLPSTRGAAAAAGGLDGAVYVFGGHDATANLDRADGLSGGAWLARAVMLSKRANLAAARDADGNLYSIGGHNFASTMFFTTVESYQPMTNTWSTRPSLIHGRSDLPATTGADGRIYAIGGFAGSFGVKFVEAYRPGSTGWVDLPLLATARDASAASVGSDGRVFVFGGRQNLIAFASGEAYGPRLVLGANHGPPDAVITLTGTNFASNAVVRIYVGLVAVELAHSDGAGALPSTSFRVPMLPPGSYRVRAIDDHSLYPVSAPFVVE